MDLDRETKELLDAIETPVPEVTADDVIARAARPSPHGTVRWAAGIALTFGLAGAAYAAPGSPLQRWLDTLLAGDPPAEAVTAGADRSGVVVPLVADLVIDLPAQTGGVVTLKVGDVDDVTVEAVNGPATFDSRARRLTVATGGSPDYAITIPAHAESVDVTVGGLSFFRVVRGEVETRASLGLSGEYRIELSQIR